MNTQRLISLAAEMSGLLYIFGPIMAIVPDVAMTMQSHKATVSYGLLPGIFVIIWHQYGHNDDMVSAVIVWTAEHAMYPVVGMI